MDNSNRANPNSPWLLFNTARRANQESSIAIANNTLNEIRDNVRRVLDYSSESETSPPIYIITEREFPFNEVDYSILANIENSRPADERTRHFGQINRRRNSLTQLDGSIFGPDKTYQAQLGEMAHSPVEPTAQSPREEIENEILRLRNTSGQNNLYFEELRPGRVTFDNQSTENMLLHELLHEIRITNTSRKQNEREPFEERNRVSRNFHENALDLTYG